MTPNWRQVRGMRVHSQLLIGPPLTTADAEAANAASFCSMLGVSIADGCRISMDGT